MDTSAGTVVAADYLVVTYPITDRAEAQYPFFAGLVANGDSMNIRGFRGRWSNKLFVGHSTDRIMVQATGSRADTIMRMVDFREYEGCSFARLDLQLTIAVPNADNVILFTRPSKVYQSTQVVSLYNKGVTLYVGAPTSRFRFRMYNKTAESGLAADNGNDFLRLEFQLRDSYADTAAAFFYAEQADSLFRTYVQKIGDQYITDMVDKVIKARERIDLQLAGDEGDWITRRFTWLENTVVPAIERLYVERPNEVKEYLTRLWKLVDN